MPWAVVGWLVHKTLAMSLERGVPADGCWPEVRGRWLQVVAEEVEGRWPGVFRGLRPPQVSPEQLERCMRLVGRWTAMAPGVLPIGCPVIVERRLTLEVSPRFTLSGRPDALVDGIRPLLMDFKTGDVQGGQDAGYQTALYAHLAREALGVDCRRTLVVNLEKGVCLPYAVGGGREVLESLGRWVEREARDEPRGGWWCKALCPYDVQCRKTRGR